MSKNQVTKAQRNVAEYAIRCERHAKADQLRREFGWTGNDAVILSRWDEAEAKKLDESFKEKEREYWASKVATALEKGGPKLSRWLAGRHLRRTPQEALKLIQRFK